MSYFIKVKAPNPKLITDKVRKQIITGAFVKQVNDEVVEGIIKKLIAAGRSPVKGWGRFEKYKDKDSYPAKQKPNRPVNLSLSGDMLRAYKTKKQSQISLAIGIVGAFVSRFGNIRVRAKANNEGEGGIPARRFIPINGEIFTVSVMRKLKELYAKRLKDILSK